MNFSSIAWRIVYRWNGCFSPSAFGVPNSSTVRSFGVAVNAKKLRFAWWPRAATTAASADSESNSSSSSPTDAAPAPRACLSALAASPVCDEWASSTMTA
jgi:hypothetical protein